MSGPLAGRRVVVTRPAGQARELVQRLAALGAQVVELPLTRIQPVAETAQIDAALAQIAAYDIIVVTSANGAECLSDRLAANATGPAEHTTIIAVGAATAAALRGRGVRVDRIPQHATGEAIVAELAGVDLTGRRVLLPRAREGRPELPARLRRAGAVVDDVAFYDTVRCPVEASAVQVALAADDIVLTAPSGAEAFSALVGDAGDLRLRIVTIGPTTSAAVRDLGLTVSAESSEQSSDGLIAAIVALGPTPA